MGIVSSSISSFVKRRSAKLHRDGFRPLSHTVAVWASSLPCGPLEIQQLGMGPIKLPSPLSAIGACLISPSASTFSVTLATQIVLVDRPLEINFTTTGLHPGASAAGKAAAHCISTHALLSLVVEGSDESRTLLTAPVSARPCDGGWIGRALIRPFASWGGAVAVTMVSLEFAGQPLSCVSIPVTLRVGYNHAPAPAGAVHAAAKTGDVSALKSTLHAGGSTEEADVVRVRERLRRTASCVTTSQSSSLLPSPNTCHCRLSTPPHGGLPATAISKRSAYSWRQVLTLLHHLM